MAFPYWNNQFIHQTEHYFLGWTAGTELSRAAWTDIERAQLFDMRWWSEEEILSTPERIVPTRLPRLWPSLRSGEIPSEPVPVGDYS